MEEKVPQYLSSPIQVFWFEADELVVILFAFMIAVVFGGFIGWGVFFVTPWAYSRSKRKYPSSFLKHLVYFSGLKVIEGYPNAFEKDFNE